MSSELDSLGQLFSALFDAQQQSAKQNGGTPSFQVLDGLSDGVAGTAEAAFNALYPGSLMNDIVEKVNKNLFAEIGVGAAGGDIANRFNTQTVVKGAYSANFQARVRNLMAQGYSSDDAIKIAKDEYGITLKKRKGPALGFNPSSLVSTIFNPAGTVDAITNKMFDNEPSTFWKVLMAGSAVAGAGLGILAASKNPHIQTKGDAVFIAGADPSKRQHAWGLGRAVGGKLGVFKRDETMALDHAADLIARATHYTRDGQVMSAATKQKVELAKEAASAIVDYAIQNGLQPEDIIKDWDAHSSNIYNFMRTNPANKKVASLISSVNHTQWDSTVKRTWVTPGLFVGPIPTAPSGGPTFKHKKAFEPKDYLTHLWAYKKNPHKWRGKRFSGVHDMDFHIKEIIDGSVNLMVRSAEAHGDYQRADAYKGHLQASYIRAHQLTRAEKIYWWKLKWDAYKEALGPQAGFGLLTGNFFLAASGAPLYEANLNPAGDVFKLVDSFDEIKKVVPASYHTYIDNIKNTRKSDSNMVFGNYYELRGEHWVPKAAAMHSDLVKFVKFASFGNQQTVDAVFNSLKMYNAIPMISKNANFMQKTAYVVGTVHPYQLLTAFLDGSLGDRFMYIGLNFGKLGSTADFANLPRWQQRFLELGLKLNNNKYYRLYRRFAMYTKFAINIPNMMLIGAVNQVKNMYIKGFKAIGKRLKRAFLNLGNRLASTAVGRTVVFQFLKQLATKIMDFFTGGLAEVALQAYNALNFITGGALDKLVFKGALYTILFMIGLVILGVGGVGLLADSMADVLSSPVSSLPSENYQYVGEGGYGIEDLDPEVVEELLKKDQNNGGVNSGIIGVAGGNSDWLYSGKDLGISTCAYRGSITQMWCNGASTYHVNHEALDIYGGEGRVPVYAIVSGNATCIRPGSSLYGFIRCRDGSFAGNGILLRGTLPDGRSVMVWHLHIIQCTFEGTQQVEAGQAIGLTAARSDLHKGDCWSGPHLHIHWSINGQKAGADLYCTLKKSCGGLPFAASISGKCDQAHLKCGN